MCDVRDLTFDGEVLHDAQGQPVHAIWRRCVTNDVLEFWDDSQALIKAVRAQKVALIGSFAGHIVHDKQICEALFHPKTQAFLTDEENAFVARTVPKTRYLDSSEIDLDEVRANKDAWIVKPTDAYGAADVYAGCFQTQEKWDEIIDRFANGAAGAPFLVQRYITPYKTHILSPTTTSRASPTREVDSAGAMYNNLEGIYCYNGRFQGVFSRLYPAYHLEAHARHHRGNHLGRRVGRRAHGLGKPHRVGGVRDPPCGELRCRRVRRCRRSRQRNDFACRCICRDHQPDDAVFRTRSFATWRSRESAIPLIKTTDSPSTRPFTISTRKRKPTGAHTTARLTPPCGTRWPRETRRAEPTRQTLLRPRCSSASRTRLGDPYDEADDLARMSTLQPSSENVDMLLAQASDTYVLDPEAIEHLDDVFGVLTTAEPVVLGVFIAAALTAVGVGCASGRRTFGTVLFCAGLGTIAIFAILGIWAAIDFEGLFAVFHSLFFAQGSWVFSADSLLITMYPGSSGSAWEQSGLPRRSP